MAHDHQLVFIREFTGQHRVYWCRDCGLIMEVFGDKYAEMLPEWSRERLFKEDRSKEKFMYVKDKIPKQEVRLGRGLKDLLSSSKPPAHLQRLLSKDS